MSTATDKARTQTDLIVTKWDRWIEATAKNLAVGVVTGAVGTLLLWKRTGLRALPLGIGIGFPLGLSWNILKAEYSAPVIINPPATASN